MSLKSLIQSGTKLWLDSIDPELVQSNYDLGATGATSNPIIINDLIKTGRFDDLMQPLLEKFEDDSQVAWHLTDHLVADAQKVFKPAFDKSKGDTGYVSFELDPLLEDVDNPVEQAEATRQYIELGKKWGTGPGRENRMIKVPATAAGLAALTELAAAGISLNVTLIFSERQYKIARDNVWAGAQKLAGKTKFKSVYSIFVSRVDVYTDKHLPDLSDQAQGLVGIVNVKRLWQMNENFWADKHLALRQEIVFASTGTKNPDDPKDKYVAALAGSDIQTNPPATNDAVEEMGKTYTRQVDKMPPQAVLDEIDKKVDQAAMEKVLMQEGTAKFAKPQKQLLETIAEKRGALVGS